MRSEKTGAPGDEGHRARSLLYRGATLGAAYRCHPSGTFPGTWHGLLKDCRDTNGASKFAGWEGVKRSAAPPKINNTKSQKTSSRWRIAMGSGAGPRFA